MQIPPWEHWISLPGLRDGGLRGVAGLYQPIQIQLTSRPTILSAGCICWVGDLSLEGGQMLISWWDTSVKPMTEIIRRGGQLCCMFRLWISSLAVSNNLVGCWKTSKPFQQLPSQQGVLKLLISRGIRAEGCNVKMATFLVPFFRFSQ